MPRARDLGISIGVMSPGPHNAITDVPGVQVGHATISTGDGPLVVGQGPVRTGVTLVLPHNGVMSEEPLFAGCHRLNGNGELTGLEWVRESGMLMSPIGLTNTHSVGVVRDALIGIEVEERGSNEVFWSLPVVGETWDGLLNDINGFHVKPEHVRQAMDAASAGPVAEGGVGSGTGMICHGFKGGIGSSSRVLTAHGGYVVGVLVQANYGRRERLRVDGVPVGQVITAREVPTPQRPNTSMTMQGAGSIIVIVATDAPLLPTQCDRLAQRAGLGVARMGGVGENGSGDLFLCFSTANRGITAGDIGIDVPITMQITALSNAHINPLFDAVVECTEEAILNCLLVAQTTVGRDGITAHGLDGARLLDVMSRFNRHPNA